MEIYKNIPKLSTIERIATALGIEPQVLFQKETLDADKENKISKIKSDVITSVEKELLRSLKQNL